MERWLVDPLAGPGVRRDQWHPREAGAGLCHWRVREQAAMIREVQPFQGCERSSALTVGMVLPAVEPCPRLFTLVPFGDELREHYSPGMKPSGWSAGWFFRPCRGFVLWAPFPTADAVGYSISPLPGLQSGKACPMYDGSASITWWVARPVAVGFVTR